MSKWHRLGRTRNCPAGIARYLIHGDTLYIWFAGTETRREWRDNFRTGTIWFEGRRVNAADHAQAVEVLMALVEAGVDVNHYEHKHFCGISRGGAIAMQAAFMMKRPPTVSCFAAKRTVRKHPKKELQPVTMVFGHIAYKGDIVPFLPPWYERMPTQWVGPWSWPWTAHIRAAKAAARWRHEVTKGGER